MDLRYQPIGQPTGRPAFAGAGLQSLAASPSQRRLLRDPADLGRRTGTSTRAALADNSQAFNRWKAGENGCA